MVADLDTLSLSESTQEAKEKYILRNVRAVLDIALPAAPVTPPPTAQHQAAAVDALAARVSAPGDALYEDLQFDKHRCTEQIRLLELLPGGSQEIVQARLFLVESPPNYGYDALSYTWGCQNTRHNITLNGQPYAVGTNLHDALVSLRHLNCPRFLWVDALCINQKDDDKKAAQVAFMGTIYCEAQNVAVFLGMDTAKSYPLFKFLNRDKRIDDVTQESGIEIIKECQMDVTAVIASFVEFCDRDWWTRVWVMQEYYLSACAPVWYIGSQFFQGEKLCRDVRALAMAAIWISLPFNYAEDRWKALGGYTTSSLADRIYRICDGVLLRRQTKPYNTPRLLFAKHGRLATQKADYVYGVRELLEPHFRQVFVPNYGPDSGGLFEKLAAWLLLMDGWGDMLWYYPFRCSPEKPGEPSWAPDFSRRPEHHFNEPEPPKFQSKDLKIVQCAIVNRILYVDGCHLDVVKAVIAMPPARDGCSQVLQKIWRLDRIYCSNQRSSYAVDAERSKRALLSWTCTAQSSILPLIPRWRETGDILTSEFSEFQRKSEAKSKVPLDAFGDGRGRGAANLLGFLCQEMECDFASACVFDFENLDSQLRTVSESPNAQMGLDLILSKFGPNDVVYEDLVRNIQSNSDGDLETFRDLVSVVRSVAEKTYANIVLGAPADDSIQPKMKSSTEMAAMRNIVDLQKARIKELEKIRRTASSSVKTGDQVILLDGLTFPLIVRLCPDSHLAVVGCANVKGVKLGHTVEDAQLMAGISAGPKLTLAFL